LTCHADNLATRLIQKIQAAIWKNRLNGKTKIHPAACTIASASFSISFFVSFCRSDDELGFVAEELLLNGDDEDYRPVEDGDDDDDDDFDAEEGRVIIENERANLANTPMPDLPDLDVELYPVCSHSESDFYCFSESFRLFYSYFV
jgi:hypothetical protein